MTRLTWGAIGERIFEAGVDRGVLYLDNSDGVAWNGLTSVSESPSGGEVLEYYVDGIKYLHLVGNEEFTATIEAFTYPDEFGVCDGTAPVGNGLFATNQRRSSFGLCYRSKIGNDVDGTEYAYKLHLVYNALAAPSDKAHTTMGDTVEPSNFSWKVTTKPPSFVGFKPTAHLVIDSRETPSDLLKQIEDILYGTTVSAARLPSIPEFIFLFQEYQASVFDAGLLTEEYFTTFDRGPTPTTPQTSTIDGGTP